MKKKILFTMIAGLLISGAVFASAASITVGGVDKLGSGTADVNPSPDVASVTYVLNGLFTSGVTLTFGGALADGDTIYVQLRNDPAGLIGSGTGTVSGVLSAGSPITVSVVANAANIDFIDVVVIAAP